MDPSAPTIDSQLPELHLHLDGSLRRSTLEELAAACEMSVPDQLGFHPGMGLRRALECFELTLAVLQTAESVRRVAAEMCEDAAMQGVTTLEIRFAPQLHRGAATEEIVDAAIDGCDGRASLILCGLYGDPPSVFDRLVEIGGSRPPVVGIDLAGGPQSGHEFGMQTYANAFGRARELGLGRTVHAGEGRPATEISSAIELLHAQRIGHGTSLLEDPSVVDLVLERDIVIEACPTSNLHTGAIRDLEAHPLPRWLDLGIKACINADNWLFSHTDSRCEHLRAARMPGMTPALIGRAIECGHRAAFRP